MPSLLHSTTPTPSSSTSKSASSSASQNVSQSASANSPASPSPSQLAALLPALSGLALPRAGARLDLPAFAGSADALAIVHRAQRAQRLLVITANPLDAQRLQDEIGWLAPGLRAHLLPD